MTVLVGRDLGEPERLRDITRQAIVIALAIMGLGSLLIWYFVGRQGLRRVEKVSAAAERIMAGDLSQRLPVTAAGDEFDQLSSRINVMLGRIGELNEGLKHVADNIAHDLKTPLTRIRNRAEAALATSDDPEATRAALERTIAESDQLIRTFAAILRISRLEAGNAIDDRGPVDLTEIAGDVCDLYEPAAEEAGGTLICEIGAEPVIVHGNRELVGQAIAESGRERAAPRRAGRGTRSRSASACAIEGDEADPDRRRQWARHSRRRAAPRHRTLCAARGKPVEAGLRSRSVAGQGRRAVPRGQSRPRGQPTGSRRPSPSAARLAAGRASNGRKA